MLREKGFSYREIAEDLGLTENCIKKFCQRNRKGDVLPTTSASEKAEETTLPADKTLSSAGCLECSNEFTYAPTGRRRKFCSDECRMAWWHKHPDQIKRNAVYTYQCPTCGESFTAYGNSHRKYCTHACYINARFMGKEVLRDA